MYYPEPQDSCPYSTEHLIELSKQYLRAWNYGQKTEENKKKLEVFAEYIYIRHCSLCRIPRIAPDPWFSNRLHVLLSLYYHMITAA